MLRLNSLHHVDCRTQTALALSALCGDVVEGYARGFAVHQNRGREVCDRNRGNDYP